MRRVRCAWVLACTALLVALAAAPASAISGVYALQSAGPTADGALVQFTVGPGGALAASAPDTPLAGEPQDVTVTPDGRFAYVTTRRPVGGAAATIAQFARVAANGRLAPIAAGPATVDARAIIVNPQGTRVHYAAGSNIVTRPINGDGTLAAASTTPVPGAAAPAAIQWLAMTPDGRSLYASDTSISTNLRLWQFDVDPASGALAPKNPPNVGVLVTAGSIGAGRMAITPSGSHLYLATNTVGIDTKGWAIDPASGALGAPVLTPGATDSHAEAAVATSVTGDALWAPSATAARAVPERIRQFSIGAAGALAPLAPPAVFYAVAGPARDLVASPDGRSLYLGQAGSVSEWAVGPGGVLSHRANVPASPAAGVQNAGITLSPSQAPVAAFGAGPSAAGHTTSFDASASSDPDGTVARYDWDFGDGTSAPDAGPAPTHVYTAPGTRTVTLTVTDADGTSAAALWTGTRMLRNGGPSARAAQSVTTATVPPFQPDPDPQPQPRPNKGRSVTVVAERGTILVRVPGSRRYVPIESLTEIPLGSIIDARKGRARIRTEVDARTGRTESSVFYDWFFRILQTKGAKPITEARLVRGSFLGCGPTRTRSASASIATLAAAAGELRAVSAATRRRSKRKVRQLWGRGTGSFRTGGKRSSATVRGTWWLVQDRCDGTLTRVKVGRVDVRDFRLRKTIRLRATTRRTTYLAKAP